MEAVPPQVAGDITADGKVNHIDFAFLANQWLTTNPASPADIAPPAAPDDFIDALDLEQLAEYWLNAD